MYHRVIFYSKSTERDKFGDSSGEYSEYLTTRGEIRITGGSKIISSEEKFSSRSLELRIRYRSDINEQMRVSIDDSSDMFMINFIEEIGRREGLRLTIEKLNL